MENLSYLQFNPVIEHRNKIEVISMGVELYDFVKVLGNIRKKINLYNIRKVLIKASISVTLNETFGINGELLETYDEPIPDFSVGCIILRKHVNGLLINTNT